MPLSARQLRALAAVTTRELMWGLRGVSREIHRWRVRARAIPAGPLREDALSTLTRKRTHIAGAALFSTLPPRRDTNLLRLLIAYETMLEFLDNAHERAAGLENGRQLHRALVDGLDPCAPISDYYRHHPWKDDGGYLRSLVECCRERCEALPAYERVQPLLLRGAGRCANAQSRNHEVDPSRRRAVLLEWTERELRGSRELSWWELSAAASSSLGVHALLAIAAGAECCEVAQVHNAYVPWICAVSTMLDSYTDRVADAAEAQHSYLAYYPSPDVGLDRVSELIHRAALESTRLADGERHAVILACMVAMYLSSDSARSSVSRAQSTRLAVAGGSLTRLLIPILRLWRIAYAQRSA